MLPFLLLGQSMLYSKPWWQVLVVVDTVDVFVKFVTDISSVLIHSGVNNPTLNKTVTIHAMQEKHFQSTSAMVFYVRRKLIDIAIEIFQIN